MIAAAAAAADRGVDVTESKTELMVKLMTHLFRGGAQKWVRPGIN